jgi:hypothetical protein
VSALLPTLLDLQHLYTWVGIVAGVAAIFLGAFWLIESVEDTLARMHDEDTPRRPRVLWFSRRVR